MPPVQKVLGVAVLVSLALAAPVAAKPHDTLQRRMVRIALHEAHMGVREVPLGSDRGPRVDRYFLAAHSRPGVAWCAAFVSYVARKAGYPVGPHRRGTVSVATLTSWGIRRGFWFPAGWRTPRAGDIAIYPSSHTGFVVRTGLGGLLMVDGNYTNAVSLHAVYEQPSGYLRLPKVRWDGAHGVGVLVAAG
ncbi:MAG: CHAP domain-containing protein [Solirubrobacteraceae bacterium]